MNFPNYADKHKNDSSFTAADVLALKKRNGDYAPPETVIFCYQRTLIESARQQPHAKKANGFFGELYLLDNRIAVAGNFGIGAPVAAALMEELFAFGVRRFVSLGLAGGLQPDLRVGDLVICDRALRDEGVSHHYLPPSKFVAANQDVTGALQSALASHKHKFITGASWTTDAPYRETRHEVEAYRQEGIITVEMEAAALFAVGQYLGAPVGAAFVIGDSLDGMRWRLDFDRNAVRRGLQILFDTTVEIFSEAR